MQRQQDDKCPHEPANDASLEGKPGSPSLRSSPGPNTSRSKHGQVQDEGREQHTAHVDITTAQTTIQEGVVAVYAHDPTLPIQESKSPAASRPMVVSSLPRLATHETNQDKIVFAIHMAFGEATQLTDEVITKTIMCVHVKAHTRAVKTKASFSSSIQLVAASTADAAISTVLSNLH
jgi:hypothetical protein